MLSKHTAQITTAVIAAAAAALLGVTLQFVAAGYRFELNAGRLIAPLLLGVFVAAGIIFVQRRTVRSSINNIASQIGQMVSQGEPGLVMLKENDELAAIATPLNEYLSTIISQEEALEAENRQLKIEACLAESEKQQTEAIIYSISDAVIVTNRFDELILANSAAESLFGFQCDSAIRNSIERLVGDPAMVRLIRETRSHGRRHAQRKVVDHTQECNGETRTFKVTLSAVLGSNGEVAGVVSVLHDMTREHEIAKMKSDFVANVSHELKTPLSSIKAYVEMLMDGEAEDEATQAEFYEIIASETDRLHRLIENILNISRIEAGVIKVVREPMSLTGVVKQAVDVARPQARQKKLTLTAELPPEYYQVEADHDMIYQAVLNLISNAIKYTPTDGEVSVNLSVDERRNVAICEVLDTGLGIPAEALPHVFEKFYRVGVNEHMAKGTGLGLTLVKHIVEAVHHGHVAVESEEGKGSRFSFELPLVA